MKIGGKEIEKKNNADVNTNKKPHGKMSINARPNRYCVRKLVGLDGPCHAEQHNLTGTCNHQGSYT